MIGYKKCVYLEVDPAGTKIKEALVILEIPDGAKIVRPFAVYSLSSRRSRKLRCYAAKVLEIVDAETREPVLCAFSARSMGEYFFHKAYMPNRSVQDCICTYIKGEIVVADKLDENELVECSSGIHFFLTEEEALDYKL